MLTATDIRELSDKDITKEISSTKDLLYRQKMGVVTNHLKDSHIIGQLKTHLARLLTIQNERRLKNEEVKESSQNATKKLKNSHIELVKSQEGKKKEAPARKTAEKVKVEDDDKDIKVKKVEKKSLLSKLIGKDKKEKSDVKSS